MERVNLNLENVESFNSNQTPKGASVLASLKTEQGATKPIESQTEITKAKVVTKSINDYRRLKQNSIGKKRTGGRNNQGRITAYHRGGGNKRRYRLIENLHSEIRVLDKSNTSLISSLGKELDYKSFKKGFVEITGIVKSIERDPNRTALIALIYWSNNLNQNLKTDLNNQNLLWSEYTYILAPAGLKVGDLITSIRKFEIPENQDLFSNLIQKNTTKSSTEEKVLSSITKSSRTQSLIALNETKGGNLIPIIGNNYLLKDLAVGTVVHNVAGKYIRAAGCSGIIISKTESSINHGESEVIVSLQSGQYKAFVGNTIVSIGNLSNPEHKAYKYRKAGQKAWLGRRPIVRGVAMNPVDHPHGGGEGKSSGGRPSVTPWGKLTKGKPTRSKAKPSLRVVKP